MSSLSTGEFGVLRTLWSKYFEAEDTYMDLDFRIEEIADFRDNFSPEGSCWELVDSVDLRASLFILFDFQALAAVIQYQNFIELFIENPDRIINCIGLGLCLVRFNLYPYMKYSSEKIFPRFIRTPNPTGIGHLKSLLVGKFVTVYGNVVRVENVSPLVIAANFGCVKCGAIIPTRFIEGKFRPPTRCLNAFCRARFFDLLRDTAITIDSQRFRIQEIEGDSSEPGRIPRTLEVEAKEDLVDCCVPGDVVTVSGILRSFNAELAMGKFGKAAKNSGLYMTYLDANSISCAQSFGNIDSEEKNSFHFNTDDLALIKSIADHPSPFELMVASLCPSILGHEIVKAGLLLALLGGSSYNEEATKNAINIRSNPHVLVVGDPGMGKSKMLQATSAVAPRSVYICGNTASASGLTVMVSKDEGDVALEAGALVLADQGVCCIDEFDKLAFNPTSLLESMEQQQISIAKGGIVASLRTRCSVVAAANPVGGHYNRSRSINENIKFGTALLSRFDLIFVLIDAPDENRDQNLSKHILQFHSANDISQITSNLSHERDPAASLQHPTSSVDSTLLQRLRSATRKIGSDVLPVEHMRKYISYARCYCKPKLTEEAAVILQTQYLEMRKDSTSSGSVPTTTRQLESLIRLSQARAKVDLRENVSEEDAKDVVDLMQESCLEARVNDFGAIQYVRGKGAGMPSMIRNFMSLLRKVVDKKGTKLFQETELKELSLRLPTPVSDFHTFIDVLRDECFLLKRGAKLYEVQV